jgi:hypothetical protein
MADFNHLSEAEAIRELAKNISRKTKQELLFLYINTGSMPFIENEHIQCRFYANVMVQNECKTVKFIFTPNEVFHWGITGGDTIQNFDTDCGK